MEPPLRIALVEDDRPTAASLCGLLAAAGFELVAVSHTAAEAADLFPAAHPDVALCDLYLDGRPSFGLIAGLHRALPDTPVVVLTAYEETALLFEALRCGAGGYVLKSDRSRPLAEAVRDAAAGHAPFSPALARQVLRHFRGAEQTAAGPSAGEGLTERQRRVLARLAEGRLNKEIAAELGITESGVKKHVAAILRRLHVPNRAAAVGVWRPP